MKLASDEQHLMAAQLVNQNHIRRVLRDVALPYSPREGSFLSGSCSPGEAKGMSKTLLFPLLQPWGTRPLHSLPKPCGSSRHTLPGKRLQSNLCANGALGEVSSGRLRGRERERMWLKYVSSMNFESQVSLRKESESQEQY